MKTTVLECPTAAKEAIKATALSLPMTITVQRSLKGRSSDSEASRSVKRLYIRPSYPNEETIPEFPADDNKVKFEQVQKFRIRMLQNKTPDGIASMSVKKKRIELQNGSLLKEKGVDGGSMRQCERLLMQLMAHKCAWVFKKPVDPKKLQIPDYIDIIKHPMDLGTVKSKLVSGAYTSPRDFAADVRLTFKNALIFNLPDDIVYKMADQMSNLFEMKWRLIEEHLAAAVPVSKHMNHKRKSPIKKQAAGDSIVEASLQSQMQKNLPLSQEKSNVNNPLDTIGHEEISEVGGCPDGRNAPFESQDSEEKLYHALMLKARYVDTILRARKKAFDMVEKSDPEMLEEFNRQQREDKARVLADAKAAKEDRKRKRQLEREAARQALQQMEETAGINEHRIFPQDLEFLNATHCEYIYSSGDETSPGEVLCLQLGRSDILEQLGLRLKSDDEEEKAYELSSVPADDIEEGEIV